MNRIDSFRNEELIFRAFLSIEEWGQVFGSISITNDIVDRLFHRASVLNIRKGISYRLHGPDSLTPRLCQY